MDTADVLIHVHPELSADDRVKLEKTVIGCNGVVAASFDHHQHPHALTVVYNPDATHGKAILDVVRQTDPAATMVGL